MHPANYGLISFSKIPAGDLLRGMDLPASPGSEMRVAQGGIFIFHRKRAIIPYDAPRVGVAYRAWRADSSASLKPPERSHVNLILRGPPMRFAIPGCFSELIPPSKIRSGCQFLIPLDDIIGFLNRGGEEKMHLLFSAIDRRWVISGELRHQSR